MPHAIKKGKCQFIIAYNFFFTFHRFEALVYCGMFFIYTPNVCIEALIIGYVVTNSINIVRNTQSAKPDNWHLKFFLIFYEGD